MAEAGRRKKKVTITPAFFPAPEHLLPQLDISAQQHEELRAFALRAARDTVRDGPTWGRSNVDASLARGWRILSAKPTGCLLIKRHKVSRAAAKGSAARGSAEPPLATAATDGSDKLGPSAGRSPPSTPSVRSGSASGQSLMAHSVLPYALEDVMSTLYNENTSEMRAATRKVYGDFLLDCCILQTLEGATLDDPFWYLGLKWIALRSPVARLVAGREFVVLEHSGTHVDPGSGRRMLYRVLQSVHVRGYGGQDSYFGLTRGHVECAFVYWMEPLRPAGWPRSPGSGGSAGSSAGTDEMLHVCMKGRLHPKGSLPLGLLYSYIKRFWKSERTLFAANETSSSGGTSSPEDASNRKKRKKKKDKKKKRKDKHKSSSSRAERVVLQGAPLEMAPVWVPDDARPRCSVCRKKFHVLHRLKHHCRACGEVICRSCTFYHELNVRDRRELGRQTLPPAAAAAASSRGVPRATSSGTVVDRPVVAPPASVSLDRPSLAPRRTLPSALDRESSMDDAQLEASLALLGEALGGEPNAEPAVVTVVTGKVCHRCIHGKSVIVASRRSDPMSVAPITSSSISSISAGSGAAGSKTDLFSTMAATQLVDDPDVDALLRSHGPDERSSRESRPNYEQVRPGSSLLSVWRPGQQPQPIVAGVDSDHLAMLKQLRLGARAADAGDGSHAAASELPRLTDDLPMILGDVESGSILGLDESQTFIGSSSNRPSSTTRVSHVSSHYEAVGAAPLGTTAEDEEDEEDCEDGEDDESSAAESSSSATSSLTSSQLRHLMDTDGSTSSSSKLRDRRNTIDELTAVDPQQLQQHHQHHVDGDEDEDDFEFYPTYLTTTGSSTLTLASDQGAASMTRSLSGGDGELAAAFGAWGFDPDCLFELKDDEDEDADEERAQLTDGSLDGLYGPLSTDSADDEGPADAAAKGAKAAAKQADVLAALTQVESALADQAALLARLQHAQGTDAAP